MSIRIPIDLPGANAAERSLSDLDERTEALDDNQRRLIDAVDKASKSLGDLGDEARDSSEGLNKTANAARGAERGVDDFGRTAQRTARDTVTMTSSVEASANNLGIELVEASQDAKFGLAGVANQIPLISEQFTQLRSKTGSTQGALKALGRQIAGPVGVIGAISLLLNFSDDIADFFRTFVDGARDSKEQLEALGEAASEQISLDVDFESRPFESIQELENALENRLQPRLEKGLQVQSVFRALQAPTDAQRKRRLRSVQRSGGFEDLGLGLTPQQVLDEARERREAQQRRKAIERRLESEDLSAAVEKELRDELEVLSGANETIEVWLEGLDIEGTRAAIDRVQELLREARTAMRVQQAVDRPVEEEEEEEEEDTGGRRTREDRAPERPRVRGEFVGEETLLPFSVNLNQRLQLSTLGEARLQIERLQAAVAKGVLPPEEVLKRKRDLLIQARDAAIRAGEIDQAVEAQRQLNNLPEVVEDSTASAFERGLERGLTSGIQAELQPLFDEIENDFARALITAISNALASEAAQRFTKKLFEGGGPSPEEQMREFLKENFPDTYPDGPPIPGDNTQNTSGESAPLAKSNSLISALAGVGVGAGAGQAAQAASGSKIAGAATGAGLAAIIAATGGAGIPLIVASGLLGGLGGFFADGGRPPVGQASIVGERGIELFVPDQPGTIVPNEALQAPSLPSLPQQGVDPDAITDAIEKATVRTVISRRASRDIIETGERERDRLRR